MNNQISAFEYVSILVSIILGLGITQLLACFADLLYNHRKVTFYWPHTLWIVFVLFLHVQDWFITYQLKETKVWYLPQLLFVLLYPITLFIAAKMLLPASDDEERFDMRQFYTTRFRIVFGIVSVCILLSVLFNIYLLQQPWQEQLILLAFLATLLCLICLKSYYARVHYLLAILILVGAVVSVIVEENSWTIK